MKKPGGPCVKCGATETSSWWYRGPKCNRCYERERYVPHPVPKIPPGPCVKCGATTSSHGWAKGPTCFRCYQRAWYARNRERVLAQQKAALEANPEKVRAKKAFAASYYWRRAEQIKERTQERKIALGLVDEYIDGHQRRVVVGGHLPPKPPVCPVCLRPGRPLVRDHDHGFHLWRGWMCRACNWAIGLLRDDPDTLRRAITYLEAHEARLKTGAAEPEPVKAA